MNIFDALLGMLNEMSPYILLGFLIAGVMHAFITPRTMSRHLSGNDWKSVVKAAAIGIPLPLCSCGVLPAAISMHRRGASNAASTSFLIATPQTGADSIAATWSMLGPAFAVIRPVAALAISLFGGMAVGKFETGSAVTQETETETGIQKKTGLGKKCLNALKYGFVDLVASIGGWLVAGLLIAALISVYLPADFFTKEWMLPVFSMIAVLIIAIPMYVCATGSIPIAMSLIMKGLSPGTALVLLMAGPAVNFASFTLVSREMGRRVAWVYLAAIITGAIAFGLLVDYILPSHWFLLPLRNAAHNCHPASQVFPTICSAILALLLTVSFIRRIAANRKQLDHATAEYTVEGMNCSHCQATVAEAISRVGGVTEVKVDLSSGKAYVEGTHDPDEVRKAVSDAGFEII